MTTELRFIERDGKKIFKDTVVIIEYEHGIQIFSDKEYPGSLGKIRKITENCTLSWDGKRIIDVTGEK